VRGRGKKPRLEKDGDPKRTRGKKMNKGNSSETFVLAVGQEEVNSPEGKKEREWNGGMGAPGSGWKDRNPQGRLGAGKGKQNVGADTVNRQEYKECQKKFVSTNMGPGPPKRKVT